VTTQGNIEANPSVFLDLNSTRSDIKSILGKPDKIVKTKQKETWWYGQAFIHLKNNKISGFYNSNKLAIKLHKLPLLKGTLNIGDSTEKIQAILGTPSSIIKQSKKTESWQFETAYLQIKENKLVAYSDAIKLQIELVPNKKSSQKKVLKGSTKDDVIHILGTPSHLSISDTHETWWYGTKYIIFRGAKVTYKDDFGKKENPYSRVQPKNKTKGVPKNTDEIESKVRTKEYHYRNTFNKIKPSSKQYAPKGIFDKRKVISQDGG
jgi:outer membrane protein assembly factor BamE (lipoprotein component of BamABCDE complex)